MMLHIRRKVHAFIAIIRHKVQMLCIKLI